jgi:predicted short-subunit dehydrogenase-like oxidoreductase (DUF2520 family)
MTSSTRLGFIGAGRVARALAKAFSRVGVRVSAVSSRASASARALAAELPGCKAHDTAQPVVDGSDVVFLCVPDDAIAKVAAGLTWREGSAVVHCSGASELDVLDAARRAGARVGSFHPLLMFADTEIAIAALPRSAIALEAEHELLAELDRLTAVLGATALRVPPGARAAYHAASHYGAAFICVLLDQGMKILEGAGMRGEVSRAALLALARGTLDALAHSEPAKAMAGVYARGDAGTAARHLGALDAMDADIAVLYRALATRSLALAADAGRVDAAKVAEIAELLRANQSAS